MEEYKTRLLEAAEELISEGKRGIKQPWVSSQRVITDITDSEGKMYTLKVVLVPFDPRPSMEESEALQAK